ncbi:hypothetical protein L7F22_062901 [Adiantum nelumboides]|nr:hypothetical protein [Adiantum nelumboides]
MHDVFKAQGTQDRGTNIEKGLECMSESSDSEDEYIPSSLNANSSFAKELEAADMTQAEEEVLPVQVHHIIKRKQEPSADPMRASVTMNKPPKSGKKLGNRRALSITASVSH